MQILFLTKYPTSGSSSRYRVHQYLPLHERAGFDCSVVSFHTDAYVRQFGGVRDWRPKAMRLRYLADRYVRRVLCVLRSGRYDLVVVEREVFPFLPATVDSVLFRVAKSVVVEYDDATYVYHQKLLDSAFLRFILRYKVPALMARSAGVVVGNRYLEAYAAQRNRNVLLAPTAIDTDRYAVKDGSSFSPAGTACIGWIGTPLTAPYLRGVASALRSLTTRFDISLRVIGAPAFGIEGVPGTAVPWSLETEVKELLSCDVGIMPLTDDAYSRGKCGAKLLQYMGAGLPAVASPVGANEDIICHGNNGFLARTQEEWVVALARLIEDVELRRQMGAAGRRTVEQDYAVSRIAPRLQAFFQAIARRGTSWDA